ncbi:oligopeptide-binding protein OppA [Corynebacterium kutscheri]|uniref:Extracellular solute-binding protein, family 5 n=1 Tax=Corynebacterium kutscheri TaxID=35755 RepID=A0A0F6TD15_9CORY|nr:ABC transporter substrate-binding protein [Corynebacterium kutscheri]AKE41341.1 extracellular solute-binding protein, family 5 [Corynebacterium kutscheri]VEH08617.1 oligopeptide-binding protein OppA [Corynebacterium kutscheri]VEH09663.1 oligopeptide-binding protein OppA [Corynebacterium kutscheri]VEH79746.1 oligopeptide-binding protein OppA [Corynebacterium kutscheri]
MPKASIRKLSALLCALSLGIAACGSADEKARNPSHGQFGYVVNSALVTTNAGSYIGASTDAVLLSTRIYPSAYVLGPKGQMIPNSDLLTTRVLPGIQQQVVYTIANDAVYSDGQPITCDSVLLAFTAGTMPELFDSYLPLMQQVDKVNCTAGAKVATVVFKDGFGSRWRQLFGPGTLLPAHAIAVKAGMSLEELNRALQEKDTSALEQVAQIWKDGFNLSAFDPELQVSAGPFKISSVGSQGEVVLVRNENYFGEAANLASLVVWPRGTDMTEIAAAGDIQVADIDNTENISWFDRDAVDNPYSVVAEPGVQTESLILATAGVFYQPENRRAFASCMDRMSVAKISAQYTGVAVQPVVARTVRWADPAIAGMSDILAPYQEINLEEAKKLSGQTIRIGYVGPDERKAAMVEAIARSCAAAEITVVDASVEGSNLGELSRTHVSQWGYETYTEGTIDAFLTEIDPIYEFASVADQSTDYEKTRAHEQASWEHMETISLATQPRVFITERFVSNVVVNTDRSGIGWNMDRWKEN